MALFRIYYSDGSTFDGDKAQDWRQAPDGTGPEGGVQYVLLMQPGPTLERVVTRDGEGNITNVEHVKTFPPIADRFGQGYVMRGYNLPYMIFTGVDDYNQLNVQNGLKFGELISDAQYNAIWQAVLADAAAGI